MGIVIVALNLDVRWFASHHHPHVMDLGGSRSAVKGLPLVST